MYKYVILVVSPIKVKYFALLRGALANVAVGQVAGYCAPSHGLVASSDHLGCMHCI